MKCLYPYTKSDGVVVRCGRCRPCLSRTRQEKFVRLNEHLKCYDYAVFVTLTYSDENLVWALNPTVCVRDIQLFIKRLRKFLGKLPFSYYAVAEYGTKFQRPHYHLVMFGISRLFASSHLHRFWQKGTVHVGSLNDRSINYVCKYHVLRNRNIPYGSKKPFMLTSNGIGKSYVVEMSDYHKDALTERYFYHYYDLKLPLPRYWKDKMFTKEEKRLVESYFSEKNPKDELIPKTRKEMRRELLTKDRINSKFDFKESDGIF